MKWVNNWQEGVSLHITCNLNFYGLFLKAVFRSWQKWCGLNPMLDWPGTPQDCRQCYRGVRCYSRRGHTRLLRNPSMCLACNPGSGREASVAGDRGEKRKEAMKQFNLKDKETELLILALLIMSWAEQQQVDSGVTKREFSCVLHLYFDTGNITGSFRFIVVFIPLNSSAEEWRSKPHVSLTIFFLSYAHRQ